MNGVFTIWAYGIVIVSHLKLGQNISCRRDLLRFYGGNIDSYLRTQNTEQTNYLSVTRVSTMDARKASDPKKATAIYVTDK